MTALMPERPTLDTNLLSHDLAAVLAAHGITADVSVRTIEQGGMYAGVTISATAYERPAGLPAPAPRDDAADLDALFRGIADRLAPTSAPHLSVVQ